MTSSSPADDDVTNIVTVRYWAAARAAAGTDKESVEAETLADLLAEITRRHRGRDRFDDVIAMCAIVVDDVPVTKADPTKVRLPRGVSVEFLPPYAGG